MGVYYWGLIDSIQGINYSGKTDGYSGKRQVGPVSREGSCFFCLL